MNLEDISPEDEITPSGATQDGKQLDGLEAIIPDNFDKANKAANKEIVGHKGTYFF